MTMWSEGSARRYAFSAGDRAAEARLAASGMSFSKAPHAELPALLILSDFAHVEGGGGKVAINEALLLAARGMRVLFLAAVGPVDDRLANSAVEVTCLDQKGLLDVSSSPGVAIQALWNRTAYRHTLRLLSTLNPANAVVHLHGYTKALSTSPLAAARRLGFRVICTLHDFFVACPNGAFFDYARQSPCHRVALSPGCIFSRCDKRHPTHKMFRVARSAVQRVAGHFPSAVSDYVVLSRRSADILRRYLPATARLHQLQNAIDVARRPPVAASANTAILCIGRLDKEKGVTFLAAAAAAAGLNVIFVGDGPLRAELEQRDNVEITGWLGASEVVGWLDRARCLVFPSLWYETYGLVVDEAAARGVPAIVSDVTAAAERVVDGVTGWHFRSSSAAALEAMLRLTLDDDAITAAGKATYERFWRDFPTGESHVGALIDVYRSMLSRKEALLF